MGVKQSLRSFLPELVAALLVLLFLYTAIMKLKYPEVFTGAMKHNPLLQNEYAAILAWLIPSLEIVITVLLIIPPTRRAGLLLGGLLMLVFTIYVAYMLATKSKLPCTCGGVLKEMTWRQHLWFNSFFTIASFFAFFFYPKRFVATKQEQPNTCEYSRQ